VEVRIGDRSARFPEASTDFRTSTISTLISGWSGKMVLRAGHSMVLAACSTVVIRTEPTGRRYYKLRAVGVRLHDLAA
jgi:hypothetical protein